MPPTTIHSAPALDTFTTLADHQSQTPTSFYGAKPVLHYHGVGVRALVAEDQVSKLPIFASPGGQQPTRSALEAAGESSSPATKVENVDAFVSSEYVIVSYKHLCLPIFVVFILLM
jgi:chloride channel, nucleotide-sensitive, 1A